MDVVFYKNKRKNPEMNSYKKLFFSVVYAKTNKLLKIKTVSGIFFETVSGLNVMDKLS